MTAFPKYSKYKDSGVEWLGEVPQHWKIERSKWLFSQGKERCQPSDEQLTASQKYGVIPQSKFVELEGRRVTAVFLNPELLKRVKKGDFVISMRSFQGGIEASEYDGAVSSAYVPLTPREGTHHGFFKHLFKSVRYIEALGNTSNLIRDGQALRFENFSMVDLPVVPLDEQQRIADFLDEKTAQIDALIAKKQRQIELLDEQKTILINRAVTRGLNPKVPLKDSGNDWIGQIPAHWIVAPLYGRCDVRLGKMLDAAKITGRRLQPYLRNTDVQWFKINTNDLPMMDFRTDEYERYSVKRGDVVVCEGGEPGRAALWDNDEPCFFQKALHRVRPTKGDDSRFILCLFRNAVTQSAFSGFDKSTIAHLTGEQLRRFRFAFPPVNEQASIADFLMSAETKFSMGKAKVESQIQTLQTLRSTLIAHAVTGKIKV